MRNLEIQTPPGRRWTKAELDERWRHQKRLRAMRRSVRSGALSLWAGRRSVQLETDGPRTTDLGLEYRESLAARLIERVAKWVAGSVRPDFCLAELQLQDLRSWAVWRALLYSFTLVPAFIAAVVALFLTVTGTLPGPLGFGVVASILVALTGTFVCGATVSVVAASLGGIPISIFLGVTNGLLVQSAGGLERAGRMLRGTALVIPGLGGLPALIRPPGLAVTLIASSIGLLSLAMGAVRNLTRPRGEGAWNVRGILRAVVLSGLGPGLILGFSLLGARLGLEKFAFGLGLALFGGIAFGAAVAVRSGKVHEGLFFGFCYASCVLLSAILGPWLTPGLVSRLLLAATIHHIALQGTFFALAYVLGERSCGPGGGVVASSFEGIAGYTGFLLSRYGLF